MISQYILAPRGTDTTLSQTGTKDEAFAVLGRGHQASIDGHIWIDLDAAHSQA